MHQLTAPALVRQIRHSSVANNSDKENMTISLPSHDDSPASPRLALMSHLTH